MKLIQVMIEKTDNPEYKYNCQVWTVFRKHKYYTGEGRFLKTKKGAKVYKRLIEMGVAI
jgi:hypothetical protein